MIFPMPNPPIRRPKPEPTPLVDWRTFYGDPLVSDEDRERFAQDRAGK